MPWPRAGRECSRCPSLQVCTPGSWGLGLSVSDLATFSQGLEMSSTPLTSKPSHGAPIVGFSEPFWSGLFPFRKETRADNINVYIGIFHPLSPKQKHRALTRVCVRVCVCGHVCAQQVRHASEPEAAGLQLSLWGGCPLLRTRTRAGAGDPWPFGCSSPQSRAHRPRHQAGEIAPSES